VEPASPGERRRPREAPVRLPFSPIVDPLTTQTVALLAIAAFAAGFVDAVAGGGGLLTVPALLAAGLPPHATLATNKGQAVFGAISSAVSFWRKDGVDRDRAPVSFGGALVGSFLGAAAVLAVPPGPLKPIVLGLLLVAAVAVSIPRRSRSSSAPPSRWVALPIGVAIGFYDGFFGPGTGSLLIVAFVVVFGDPLVRASGNAKIANLASNLAAVSLFAWRGEILWRIAIPMAVANAIGAAIGARTAMKRGNDFVRVVVLVVVAALVGKVLWDLAH
jgi:uncharacterized membrane protein YfcA